MERLLTTTLSLVALVTLAGCGDSTSTSGTASTGASAGGTCAPGSGCPTAKTDCLGLVDNSGQGKFALRISHLSISKPAQLATPVVKQLLASGIDLNLSSCKADDAAQDPIFPTTDQTGAFSWILEFDTAAGTLRTGGATPVEDPTKGYCFVTSTIQGLPIAPLSVQAPIMNGKFSITMPEDVVVPVYSDRTASTVILLPLKGVTIQGITAGDQATISADNNCIGTYNGSALQPTNNCLSEEGPPEVPQFNDGAALTAYMDLEQADSVAVSQLGGETLCVLLSGNAAMYGDATGKKCKRDGNNKIIFQGDWCGSMNIAATPTCADAISLGATFAASSVALQAGCE